MQHLLYQEYNFWYLNGVVHVHCDILQFYHCLLDHFDHWEMSDPLLHHCVHFVKNHNSTAVPSERIINKTK